MGKFDAALCALDFVGVEVDRAREHLPAGRRQTLAMLIAAGPSGMRIEAAADELWPTDLPDSWEASIRMAFSRLRKHTGTEAVVHDRGHCRLGVDPDQVDIWRVARLADACRSESGGPQLGDSEPSGMQLLDELIDAVALITKEPFPGVETTPSIMAAIAHFEAHRTTILERLAAADALRLDEHQVLDLQRLAERSPWDEDLQELVAAVLATNRRCAKTTSSSRSAASDRNAVPNSSSVPASRTTPGSPSDANPLLRSAGASLPHLDETTDSELVGRTDLIRHTLDAAQSGPGAVLIGSHGSGTSAVLDAVERELRRSPTTVVRMASLVASDVAFGAFLEQVAAARGPVTDYLQSNGPQASRLAACWIAVLDSFEQATQHVVFLIDRIEALDSHSLDLVGFLLRSKSTCAVSVIVGADSTLVFEGKAAGWPVLEQLEVAPLQVDDVVTLLARRDLPGTASQLEQLARDMIDRTGGLAGRIAGLADTIDPETLTVPGPVIEADAPEWVVRRLSPAAATTATVAAMLGPQVTIDELCSISGLDEADVRTAIEQLLEHRVLVEHQLPDRYRVSDSFAQRILLSFVDDAERRRLHLRVAEHIDDPGRRAWHIDHARPLTSDHECVDAHIAAARHHIAHHSYREAVSSFRAAQQLAPDQLDAAALTGYAVALARVGIDNRSARRAAMESAGDDEALRLDAAMAGLPESEKLDGDPSRVDDLLSIDRTMLKPPERVRHSAALSRELLLAGDHAEATRWAVEATDEATSADERAIAWLAREHITGWTGSSDADAAITDLDDIDDMCLVGRILQATTISALVKGDSALSRRLTAVLHQTAEELGDPLRQWHAELIRAFLAEEQLDFDEADRIADRALDLGFAHGLPLARSARIAQRLARKMALPHVGSRAGTSPTTQLHRISGERPSTMSGVVGPLAEPGTSSILGRMARLRTQLAGLETVTDDTIDECLQLLAEAVGSRFEIRVIAVAAPLIAGVPRAADVLERCRRIMEARRGTALIVGAGFSSSGPADLTLAELADDLDERQILLHEAVALADRWQSPRWQLITRFRLYQHLSDLDDRAITATERNDQQANVLAECRAIAEAAPTPLRVDVANGRLALHRIDLIDVTDAPT